MPNQIEPYAPGPGSLANTVVGTPGLNHQAGSEWFKLADAAGQAREGIARNQMSAAGQMFGMLDQIAGAVGSAIGRHAFAKQKQSNYLNMSAVNTKAYEFQSALNAKQNVFKQQYADDPQNATNALGEMVDNNAPGLNGQPSFVNDRGEAMDVKSIMNWAQNDASLKNDPQALAHLQDRLMSIRQQKLDQTEDWAFTARTKNAESSNDIARHDVVSSISMQSGDMGTRYKDFQELMSNAKQRIADNSPILGTAKTQLDSIKLDREAGAAYIESGIANSPEEPVAALTHLADVRAQLDNAAHLGIDIEPQAKITLQGKIESHEAHHMEMLKQDMISNQVGDIASIAARKADLSLDAKNIPKQQAAKYWVSDQIKLVNQSIDAVKQNTILPDKAKNAIITRLTGQLSKLDGLTTEADTNIRTHEAAQRQAESDARREANADRRDANAARREAERLAKADLKERSLISRDEISRMRDELNTLMTEPVKNKDEIIQKAAEVSAAVDKAVDARHIPHETGTKILRDAHSITKTAAEWKQDPAILWYQPPIERIKPESAKGEKLAQVQKRQAEYIGKMEQIRRTLAEDRRDDYLNEMYRGMNTAQRARYDRDWPLMRAHMQAQKWDAAKVNQAKEQFIARIFQLVPATPIRQAPGGPPPPGARDMQPVAPRQANFPSVKASGKLQPAPAATPINPGAQ